MFLLYETILSQKFNLWKNMVFPFQGLKDFKKPLSKKRGMNVKLHQIIK